VDRRTLRVSERVTAFTMFAEHWLHYDRMHAPRSAVEHPSSVNFLNRMAAALAAGNVDLPAFPQVVIDVQEAFKDANYTPQSIARVIATERSLADRLLQMANSAAFNVTGRVIIDLGVAVTRLGAQKVYSIAIAHAIQYIRQSEHLRSIARPLDELWTESVTVAHFCGAVAKRVSLPAPDAFVAGLLHDIGRFYILVQCVGRDPARPPMVVSEQLIHAWQPAIGKAVLQNWRMSEAVCEAVGAQAEEHVVRPGPATLTDVLAASIRLAKRQRNVHDNSSLSAGGALARLNLPLEVCHALIAEAAAEIRVLQRALRP
jgi:HD-like signal output (HDOD) protein